MGCALDDGGFETIRDADADVRELKEVTISDADTALIFFAMRLLHRLQQMGTVPAIDYTAWGEVIPGAE